MNKKNMGLLVIFVAASVACASENITTKPSPPLAEFVAAPAKYAMQPEMQLLRFGEVKPAGWLREQMQRDLESGFAGHMQEIASNTASSDIFTTGRKHPNKLSNPGAQGWWNGETEGNWRSGNTMLTLLAGSPEQRAALDARIADLLKFQDADELVPMGCGDAKLRRCTFPLAKQVEAVLRNQPKL